jgi:hypothetical protein
MKRVQYLDLKVGDFVTRFYANNEDECMCLCREIVLVIERKSRNNFYMKQYVLDFLEQNIICKLSLCTDGFDVL